MSNFYETRNKFKERSDNSGKRGTTFVLLTLRDCRSQDNPTKKQLLSAKLCSSNSEFIKMKLITGHLYWWALLFTGSVIVSAITSYTITFPGMISSISGHILFAVGIALLPWLFYRLIGKPLTSEQMMATITVGWLILAVANLSV